MEFVYRYTQIDGDEADTRYYNRYFFAYDQPFFQPNRMKNDLERAQLDLEDSELDYQDDVAGMIDDLADDYYELLELAYRREIASRQVLEFETAMEIARVLAVPHAAARDQPPGERDPVRGDEGRRAFRMNLGITYGREVQDPLFQGLWATPRNSYTVNVSATVPIFDWGERRMRIQAQQYSIERACCASSS